MVIKNFFKFLEGKGKDIPLSVKLMLFPEEIKPEDLNVTGDLDLSWLPIKTLPEGLTVGGDLDLSWLPIKTLPEGLTVGGDLDLKNCDSLVSLPEGLSVGGDLYLFGCTSLVSLPKGLKIEKNLYISKKFAYKNGGKRGIRKFIKDNGGYVKGEIEHPYNFYQSKEFKLTFIRDM